MLTHLTPNLVRSDGTAHAMLSRTRLWTNFRWGIAFTWRAAPRLVAGWSVVLVLQALLAPASLLATREAVNRIATHHVQWSELLGPIVAVGAVWLMTQMLSAVASWLRVMLGEQLRDHVQLRVQEQALRQDLAFFETPASFDLLHRARVDAIMVPATLVEHSGVVIQNGLALLAIACVLTTYAGWLPLLLVASAVPALFVLARYTVAANRMRLSTTSLERRSRYLDQLLTQRESAAELRLFGLGGHFRTQYLNLRQQLRSLRERLELSKLKAETIATLAAAIGMLGGMLWIVQRAVTGLAKLGDVVLAFQSFQQGQRLLRALLDAGAGIYRGVLFIDNLRTFLDLTPAHPASENPKPLGKTLRSGVRFENVRFSYPGSERTALDGVTLHATAGTITAIVGDNGAGKSSLLKLLCRFFDPDSGRISLDGQDVRDFDPEELRRQITVLFQEPMHHHGSVTENIGLGDLAAGPERIHAAALAAGADGPVSRLPQGYETTLGKWFGGAELSTGEWQRIALARAFLRDSPIVALDEPTSAMDTWAEADWLARFRQLVAGRTTFIVTHRFTTAMLADQICVLREGRVVESGTHRELLAADGYYAKGWREQMREQTDTPRAVANA